MRDCRPLSTLGSFDSSTSDSFNWCSYTSSSTDCAYAYAESLAPHANLVLEIFSQSRTHGNRGGGCPEYVENTDVVHCQCTAVAVFTPQNHLKHQHVQYYQSQPWTWLHWRGVLRGSS